MQSSPCSEERKGRVSPGVMESEIPFDYYWRNKMLANHHLNVNKIISIHFNSASLQLNIRSVLRQIDLNCNFIITCKVSDCTPVRDSSYIHFQSNCRCQILTCIGQGNLTISCDIYILALSASAVAILNTGAVKPYTLSGLAPHSVVP